MRKTIYILVLLISTFSMAQNNTLFSQGNSLYNEGQFQEAISTYESILEMRADGKIDPISLYFSLITSLPNLITKL